MNQRPHHGTRGCALWSVLLLASCTTRSEMGDVDSTQQSPAQAEAIGATPDGAKSGEPTKREASNMVDHVDVLNDLVKAIVSLPAITKPAVEAIVGVQLEPSPNTPPERMNYEAPIAIGTLEHIYLDIPTPTVNFLNVGMRIRSGIDIPISAFHFDISKVQVEVSRPGGPRTATWTVRDPAGYAIHHIFDSEKSRLMLISIGLDR